MCLMWIYACVLSPFVIAFVAGNFAVEDDIRDSFIKSYKSDILSANTESSMSSGFIASASNALIY